MEEINWKFDAVFDKFFSSLFLIVFDPFGLTFAQPIFDVMNTKWQHKKSVSPSAPAIETCSFILKTHKRMCEYQR